MSYRPILNKAHIFCILSEIGNGSDLRSFY